LIDCEEVFQVVDAGTGKVVQGMTGNISKAGNIQESKQLEGENVTHLVRFEMPTFRGAEPSERELGSWKIIDWDDLLHGNVWH